MAHFPPVTEKESLTVGCPVCGAKVGERCTYVVPGYVRRGGRVVSNEGLETAYQHNGRRRAAALRRLSSMATRAIVSRHVTWLCTNCTKSGNPTIQTTESAERHADDTGHTVVASGMTTYRIGPGTVESDDPFVRG